MKRTPDLSQALLQTYLALCSYRHLALVLVGAFTMGYFAATCVLASGKPFRSDELYTYQIARLPSAAAVWRTWLESDEAAQPVIHLATHFFGSAIGFSHVNARLPDMLGFWVMCVCIFVFLSRRTCPMVAWIGMLLPLTAPQVYFYAYEMRGYGIVLACSAAAVVCWDLTNHSEWRRVARLGLPICLAAAIATHLYAVLVIVPLALAELARTAERRQRDWSTWTGIAFAILFFAANLSIVSIRRLPWLPIRRIGVSVPQLMNMSLEFLSVSAMYFGLLAVICAFRNGVSRPDDLTSQMTRERQLPLSDWVLAVGLSSLPTIGWVTANLFTNVMQSRYVLAAVIGFCLSTALLCWVAIRRRPEIALLLAMWTAITAAGSVMTSIYWQRTATFTTTHVAAGEGCFRLLKAWDKLRRDDLPIVVTSFDRFTQLHHYAPDALKERLVFLVDRKLGRLIEPMMPFYARVFGQRMDLLEHFAASQRSFYVYDCRSSIELPIMGGLLDAGASLHHSGLAWTDAVSMGRELYRVSMTGDSTEDDNER
jgi:hypothetical protein